MTRTEMQLDNVNNPLLSVHKFVVKQVWEESSERLNEFATGETGFFKACQVCSNNNLT